MNLEIFTNKKGTALLVALLVMGVLISISLAISSLVLREVRITADFLDAGKAYYAAESGIEVALFELEDNLPGWEPGVDEDGEYAYLKVDDEFDVVSEYKVKNRCNAYPCFDDEDYEGIDGIPFDKLYDVLELNESITIPLFVADENVEGGIANVEDFVVEYFVKFDPVDDLVFANKWDISGWDVLRWKVFGINGNDKTGTISDFTAVSSTNGNGSNGANGANGVNDGELTGAEYPSWFGTINCDQLSDRYNDDIKCLAYGGSKFEIAEPGQISTVLAGTCMNTQAREYYDYVAAGDEGLDAEDIHHCYEVGTFLDNHDYNYLSLTNYMNPSVLNSDRFNIVERENLSRLYFRVELEGKTVREYADITANGYSGDSKQSISVQIKRGSFMPVFNFSLYSTYGSDAYYDEQ